MLKFHNTPDKYSQVYRILLPICNTLSQIPRLNESSGLRNYIEGEFGSADSLMREILGDFFRHGFDGSGADNFFDAGSCIDGRLTSAWNWCTSLEKKKYFPVFLLTGNSTLSPFLNLLMNSQQGLSDLMVHGDSRA
jgi:hypothetical protein